MGTFGGVHGITLSGTILISRSDNVVHRFPFHCWKRHLFKESAYQKLPKGNIAMENEWRAGKQRSHLPATALNHSRMIKCAKTRTQHPQKQHHSQNLWVGKISFATCQACFDRLFWLVIVRHYFTSQLPPRISSWSWRFMESMYSWEREWLWTRS